MPAALKDLIPKMRRIKKEQWMLCLLGAALLAVILIPAPKKDSGGKEQEESALAPDGAEDGREGYAGKLEYDLTQALASVEGVGAVEVMITLESTGTKVVEKDHPASSSTSEQTREGETDSSVSSDTDETTVYEKDAGGSQTPYVVSETLPQIRGVLVIAEGGSDPVIIRQIQEAVMALFHIDVNKIKVMKMK